LAAGLVAAEHVEVGRVDLRVLAHERRLAVARRHGGCPGDGGGGGGGGWSTRIPGKSGHTEGRQEGELEGQLHGSISKGVREGRLVRRRTRGTYVRAARAGFDFRGTLARLPARVRFEGFSWRKRRSENRGGAERPPRYFREAVALRNASTPRQIT